MLSEHERALKGGIRERDMATGRWGAQRLASFKNTFAVRWALF